jgi:Na+/glutamate symporter
VIAWEFLYFFFMPDVMDKYSAYIVEKMRASGQSAQAIQTSIDEMKKFKAMYDNPLINAALTFIEPFPVGLIISLISALVLRKRRSGPTPDNSKLVEVA